METQYKAYVKTINGTPFYFVKTYSVFPEFKNIEPGTYTIGFSLPRVGQLMRTIELTPSFADAKGKIEKQFEYTPDQLATLIRPEERATVSVRELKISYGSRREFEREFKLRSAIQKSSRRGSTC